MPARCLRHLSVRTRAVRCPVASRRCTSTAPAMPDHATSCGREDTAPRRPTFRAIGCRRHRSRVGERSSSSEEDMRRIGITVLMAGLGLATIAATAQPADTAVADASWDLARMGRTIAAARQARQAGDLDSAERLCRVAFESVDRSALATYDAYADRLKAPAPQRRSGGARAVRAATRAEGGSRAAARSPPAPISASRRLKDSTPTPTSCRAGARLRNRSACTRSRSPTNRCSRRTSSGP